MRRIGCRLRVAVLGLAMVGVAGVGGASAQTSPELAASFARATTTLYELIHLPDLGVPREVLARAHAIAVFPGVVKGALIFGGQSGSGVVTARRPDGKWSPPALYTLGGGSIGLQIGAEVTDIVLVVTNRAGLESLARGEVTLGADLSATAGPAGRRMDTGTDWRFQSDILSYSRSKGLFAGMSVSGVKIAADDDDNRLLYGRGYTAREILLGNQVSVPEVAKGFVQTLESSVPARP